MDDNGNGDICRVCRSEGSPDRPLFHPCICTGSIKYIHQECLVQWMRYSRKEYCELCSYRFSFTPIYSPDMPRRLPIRDIVSGLVGSIVTAVRYWFHYTLVAVAWLGVVPLTACRVYRCLFNGSVDSVLTLPLDMFSTENIWSDIFHGCFVVSCTLFAFIGLVWLREQILHGGGPDWLEPPQAQPPPQPPRQQQQQQPQQVQDPLQQDQVPPAQAQPQQPQAQPQPPPPQDDIRDNLNNNLQDNLAQVLQPQEGELQGVVEEGGGGGGEWNPLEWDRAAEELTWERLLGLDGSLVFLEHVFWVVSLNTLFILVFAFCPYHMGHFVVSTLGFKQQVSASHFQGLLTTLCGYCVIGICLVSLHSLAALLSLVKSRRILGHCYVVVKVSLLSVVEIGVLPLVCGWWLDVCSLSLFDATLRDRQASFGAAPGTSMFIHWLVGMVYVYYFASFVLLLREVLRPGVLWFLRNLNEPDFSPIQEMIHLPIVAHVRRLLASAVIFGSAVLLMLWLPIRIIRYLLPEFLPYTVALHSESQVNELSLELLLLQVILPALLEQSQTRAWLKVVVRWWCGCVSYLLDIRSYLLGEGTGGDNNRGAAAQAAAAPQPDPAARELGAAHHAMLLNRAGPTGFEPYTVPRWFGARLVLLLAAMCGSLVVASVLAFTVPVSLGRWFMSVYPGGKPQHELYTVASGTYMCWLIIRCVTLVVSWVPRGREVLVDTVKSWGILLGKSVVALTLLVGVIPLMSGLLLELVLVVPLRVPLDQTPVLWLWQDWALGVLYTKIVCALTMMGPDWTLRQAIERVYRDGIRGMQLSFIIQRLALPVIGFLAVALSLPYVMAHSIAPLFITKPLLRILIERRVYPLLLLLHMTAFLVAFQLRQFARLYEHIKNDKYLIGRRLVNYHHKPILHT